MSLLSVESLSKSYFGNSILSNISFRLNEGDKLSLIGSNGAGKTTLFRIITGEKPADSGRVVISKGAIIGYLSQRSDDIADKDQDVLSSIELTKIENSMRDTESKIAKTIDHSSEEYINLTHKYSQLTDKFEAMDGYAYERNMLEILTGLSLSKNAFDTPMHLLSGGEKIRVALAHLLLKRPDILLLDEPTNHLDIAAMEWLEDTLLKFKGAVIIISHDRYFIDRVCNKTAELQNASLTYRAGNYSSFMAQKEIETDFMANEKERLEKEIERQSEIKQTMFSHRNMSGYHMKEKVIHKLVNQLSDVKTKTSGKSGNRMNFSLMKSNDIRNPKSVILRGENLGKSFNSVKLFENISFEINAIDKVFFVGPNGCGKSTLLSILLGQIEEFEGNVKLTEYSTYAFMGQKVTFENENSTIMKEVTKRFDFTEGQARTILANFGFYDTDVHKRLSVLSGGERSRLYLALILQENPEIIFLDEPTNHLDIASREILEKAINNFGGALVAVSHDRYFIEKCAKRIIGFVGGTAKEFLSYAEYRTMENIPTINEEKIKVEEHNTQWNPSQTRKNKAQERRERANIRERIQNIESTLLSLEKKKEEMESDFGPETHFEIYNEYSDILSKIEKLYFEYDKISNEHESFDQE